MVETFGYVFPRSIIDEQLYTVANIRFLVQSKCKLMSVLKWARFRAHFIYEQRSIRSQLSYF